MRILETKKQYQAYGYVRISQDDEDKLEESNSIRHQKMLIEDFVKSHEEIHLAGFKKDDGCSGVTFDREGFRELMEVIRAGKCDCVIVKDLSRFGRNYIEAGKYIERLFPALGVRFIAINDSYDSAVNTGLADSILLPFKNLINDMYSRDISVKVRSNLEVRRRKGDFVGPHLPYGYKRDPQKKGHFMIDPHPAEIVRKIFSMRIEGNSRQAIAGYLNQAGEPSPAEYKKLSGSNYQSGFQVKDKPLWSAQTVGRILRNEVYAGTMVQKKVTTRNYKLRTPVYLPAELQIRVANTHEAIVDMRLFRLVQQIRGRSRSVPAGKSQNAYLFSGVLFCGRCGNKLEGQTALYKGKKYVYYLCPCCQEAGDSNRVKEAVLYALVQNALRSYMANIVSLDAIHQKMTEIPFRMHAVKRLEQQRDAKRRELEKYTKLQQALHEDYMRGILSGEEMRDYYRGYQARRGEAEKAMEQLQRQIEELHSRPMPENRRAEGARECLNGQALTRGIVCSTLAAIHIMDKRHICLEFAFRCHWGAPALRARTEDNGK